MLVAGWADGYRNNTFRTFERRAPSACCRAVEPHVHGVVAARPAPRPRARARAWFGHHLRGDDNGVDTAPPIQVFVRRPTRPAPDLAEVRGEWRSEPGWPLERARVDVLRPEPAEGVDELPVQGDVGAAGWISCAGRLPWGQPTDQREDDARSLTYEWGPFDEEVEILGQPVCAWW